MATQSTAPPSGPDVPDVRRIGQIAGKNSFAEAVRWFVRERAWINEKHLQVCRVPAATFFEQPRAEWFRDQLESLGWASKLDRAGNVLATTEDGVAPSLVLSAHLDTVFAPSRPEDVYYGPEGRLYGPGVSDNGSGLAALLAVARLLADSPDLHDLASSLLLVANVGEEGEGNLSGMRYLCRQVSQFSNLSAFIVLDGPSTDHVTAQALASRRFEVTFSGPVATVGMITALQTPSMPLAKRSQASSKLPTGALSLTGCDLAPITSGFLKGAAASIPFRQAPGQS